MIFTFFTYLHFYLSKLHLLHNTTLGRTAIIHVRIRSRVVRIEIPRGTFRIVRIATQTDGSGTPTSLAIIYMDGITSHAGFRGFGPHAELVLVLRKCLFFLHLY